MSPLNHRRLHWWACGWNTGTRDACQLATGFVVALSTRLCLTLEESGVWFPASVHDLDWRAALRMWRREGILPRWQINGYGYERKINQVQLFSTGVSSNELQFTPSLCAMRNQTCKGVTTPVNLFPGPLVCRLSGCLQWPRRPAESTLCAPEPSCFPSCPSSPLTFSFFFFFHGCHHFCSAW